MRTYSTKVKTSAKRSYKISDSPTTNYLSEENFSNCEFPPREHLYLEVMNMTINSNLLHILKESSHFMKQKLSFLKINFKCFSLRF